MRETLLAVDGNSLMHRAFYAVPLLDTDGVYTNAAHGFLAMLFKAMQDKESVIAIVSVTK